MDHLTTEPALAANGHPAGEIDLRQFCTDDVSRPYLNNPFRIGEFTYATNGHLIVRVRAAETGVEESQRRPKRFAENVEKIFAGIDAAHFEKPPAVDLPPASAIGKCQACDGRGRIHDCPDCDCIRGACGGEGEANKEATTFTTFTGALFRLKYVRQVLALPGVEVAPGTADADERRPLLFRFTGGAGALMPCSRKHLNHVEIEPRKGSEIT